MEFFSPAYAKDLCIVVSREEFETTTNILTSNLAYHTKYICIIFQKRSMFSTFQNLLWISYEYSQGKLLCRKNGKTSASIGQSQRETPAAAWAMQRTESNRICRDKFTVDTWMRLDWIGLDSLEKKFLKNAAETAGSLHIYYTARTITHTPTPTRHSCTSFPPFLRPRARARASAPARRAKPPNSRAAARHGTC